MMELTQKQQEVVDAAINARAGAALILTGEGGSGKTECLARIAKTLPNRVSFITPTHQSKNVLAARLRRSGLDMKDISIQTTAAFLGKRPNKEVLPDDDDLLGQSFNEGVEGKGIGKNNIIICDETSMIGITDFMRIAKIVTDNGVLIVAADFNQLPPVNEKSAVEIIMQTVTAYPERVKHFHLEQNLRANSKQLISYLNRIPVTGQFPLDNLPDDGSVVYVRSHSEFMDKWVNAVREHGAENVLNLAYTNDCVNRTAAEGRLALGYPQDRYMKGELLRADAPFRMITWKDAVAIAGTRDYDGVRTVLDDNSVQTGDVVQILSGSSLPWDNMSMLSFDWLPGHVIPMQGVRVRVLSGAVEGKEFDIKLPPVGTCIDQNSDVMKMLRAAKATAVAAATGDMSKLDAATCAAVKRAMLLSDPKSPAYWYGKLFYSVREMIFVSRSALCMTAHKAQGTGKDFVFLNARNIGGPDANELRYTSASRTIKQLTVFL